MKTVYIIFIGLLTHFNLMSQSTILSSTNKEIGITGTVTYSVGQLMYTIETSNIGSVSNGIQQPFEIMNLLNISQTMGVEIMVYPNPFVDFLILKMSEKLIDHNYYLYDTVGKLLDKKSITSVETIISMKELPIASYFLKIANSIQIIKTIKIIKK